MSNQYGKKIGFEDIQTLFTQISRPKENRRHVKHKVVYTSVAQEMFQCCYDNVAKIYFENKFYLVFDCYVLSYPLYY